MMRAVPFVPFEIHLSDGRSFVIEHPEFMALTSDYKTLLLSMDPDESNNYQTVLALVLGTRHVNSALDVALLGRLIAAQ